MSNGDITKVSALCRVAKEAARRAGVAAAEAARAKEDAVARAAAATDPLQRAAIKAEAVRRVTNSARSAEREAKSAREAAGGAEAAAKEITDALFDAEAAVAAAREANEAKQAADEAESYSKAADEARKEAISNYAVEEELKVEEFFDVHKEQIYKKLEECDEIAENAPTNGDMIFIAESLPIINSIIHVGTDRKKLTGASNWVRKTWGEDADPLIVLSALLFIYVANKGALRFTTGQSDEPVEGDREEIWNRIHRRVQKLL